MDAKKQWKSFFEAARGRDNVMFYLYGSQGEILSSSRYWTKIDWSGIDEGTTMKIVVPGPNYYDPESEVVSPIIQRPSIVTVSYIVSIMETMYRIMTNEEARFREFRTED